MTEPVQVIAVLKVKPDQIQTGKPVIAKLVELTRQQPGVIRYDLFQDSNQPTTYVLLEKYASQDVLKKHMQTEHFKEASAKAKEFLSQPIEIRVLKATQLK